MEVNYWTLAGAVLFLAISLLSVYRPNLVWGKPRPVQDQVGRQKLIRRRQIGTLVYFGVGTILLVLSFR
jgi:hypothetical protein